MIQFIRNLTESNNNLASAIKVQTSQDKQQGGRMRELLEKLEKLAGLTQESMATLRVNAEVDLGSHDRLTKKLDEFLETLTSFFALQEKLDTEKKEEEIALKPTAADLRY